MDGVNLRQLLRSAQKLTPEEALAIVLSSVRRAPVRPLTAASFTAI